MDSVYLNSHECKDHSYFEFFLEEIVTNFKIMWMEVVCFFLDWNRNVVSGATCMKQLSWVYELLRKANRFPVYTTKMLDGYKEN